MYIGIDLGTSGVKAILLSEQGDVLATQTENCRFCVRIRYGRNRIRAVVAGDGSRNKGLGEQHSLREVTALGIAGQMHGATLLDSQHRVLRPAILWNDGRCGRVRAPEERVPASRDITGNLMMPGFTAPKLLWVQRHEPEIFRQVAKVLLPKDYLRFRMTGILPATCPTPLAPCGSTWRNATGARRCWMPVISPVSICPHS